MISFFIINKSSLSTADTTPPGVELFSLFLFFNSFNNSNNFYISSSWFSNYFYNGPKSTSGVDNTKSIGDVSFTYTGYIKFFG